MHAWCKPVLSNVLQNVDHAAKNVPKMHPFRQYVDKIIKEFPKEKQDDFRKGEIREEMLQESDIHVPGLHEYTMESLEKLFKRTKVAIRNFKICCT